MNCIPFPKPPIRAIRVEPFNARRSLWHAYYDGDEWTDPIEFKQVERIGILLPRLMDWQGRNGRPIVVDEAQRRRLSA